MRALHDMPLKFVALLLAGALAAACAPVEIPEIPGLPDELREIPEVLEGWELPLPDSIGLPALTSLPAMEAAEGELVYRGPTLRVLEEGDALPGTDVSFEGVEGDTALFTVSGLRSPKRVGDSVEFSGAWPGITGSHYDTRLRIVWIGDESVRLAGVHQILLPDVEPVADSRPSGQVQLRFPFVDGVVVGGDTIDGTTLAYLGKYERGAQFVGLPPNEYPYRQVADSLIWEGALRADVGAEYDLRVLRFGVEGARVAGTVLLSLP